MYWDLIDDYKPISESIAFLSRDFMECKRCGEFPKLWIFDNGEYAACKCHDKYGKHIKSESIMSVHKRTGGKDMTQHSNDNLVDAWNHFVETREILELPEGRW